MQQKDTVSRTETRCRTVYETHKKTIGYDVHYRLGKEEGDVVRVQIPGGMRELEILKLTTIHELAD